MTTLLATNILSPQKTILRELISFSKDGDPGYVWIPVGFEESIWRKPLICWVAPGLGR